MQPDNLLSLKDDMVAFIEGHGMRRFPGFVGDDVPSILWEDETNPDSWKDFVEMAKTASAAFLTMSESILEKEDLELLIEHIRDQNFPDEEAPELEEVQYLVELRWQAWIPAAWLRLPGRRVHARKLDSVVRPLSAIARSG